jgi:uncharacterized protein YbaR (Trm112 family)
LLAYNRRRIFPNPKRSTTLKQFPLKASGKGFRRHLLAMRAEILPILRCPEDRTPLALAADALVDEVNAAIRAGNLVDRAGRPVEQTIDAGLVRTAGDVLYPIVDQIPVLLVDESIDLNQIRGSSTSP